MSEDLYRLLKVSNEAPEREIKRSYHRLARKMHPDKSDSPEDARRIEEEFAAITRAYNILKDPARRKEYDGQREKEEASGGAPGSPTPKPPPASSSGSDEGSSPGKTSRRPDKGMETGRAAVAKRSARRGEQLAMMGDHVRAIEFFETAVRNNANEPEYHANLAKSLMAARRGFTRAVEAANRACELDQFNVEYKAVLAQIYMRAGSTSLAIKEYENILKWEPENYEAITTLEKLRGKGRGSSSISGVWSKIKGMFGS